MFNLNGPATYYVCAELDTMKEETFLRKTMATGWREEKMRRVNEARAILNAAGLKATCRFQHPKGDEKRKAEAEEKAEKYAQRMEVVLKLAGCSFPVHTTEGMLL